MSMMQSIADRGEDGENANAADLQPRDSLHRLEMAALRTQFEAAESERVLLRALIDLLPAFLFVKDAESRFLIANRATALDIGVDDPADLIGKTDLDFHPPEIGRGFFEQEQALLASGEAAVDIEQLVCHPRNGAKWFSATKVPLRNDDGAIIGLVGVCYDITNRKRAKELRIGQAQILEMVASGACLDVVLEKVVLFIESQVKDVVGAVLLVDGDSTHFRIGAAPSFPDSYRSLIDQLPIDASIGSCGTAVLAAQQVIVPDIRLDWRFEAVLGFTEPLGLRGAWSTPVLSHKGPVLGALAVFPKQPREPTAWECRLIDLATQIAGIAIDRKRAEDRIQFMAHHDALTGLPNRTLLLDRLNRAILMAERQDQSVTVVFVDLDNFKLVNDSLGHSAGDELLRTVARRLTGCLGAPDTVVRLGGDEFVLLLADLPRQSTLVAKILSRLQTSLSLPVNLDGQTVQVTCSMGVATYPGDGCDAEALLGNADVAMYRAKEVGKNQIQFYAAAMNSKAHERLSLLAELHTAIEKSELYLCYQPQVDLRSGRIFALEALVRWRHPARGELPPDAFIPLAEESGLIVTIGRLVLREACRQNVEWQAAGMLPVTVCVNVSAFQFRDKSLVGDVSEALADSGLDARHLELELTESMVMQDVDPAIDIMRNLADLGVKLSIDDFGTGYSSLSALKRFPVARLKIDKSFIGDLQTDDNDRAIATAVISMGHKLNMRVIAEGVETPWQLDFLRENECDEVQGFHISRPLPAADVPAFLKRPPLRTP